MKSESEVNMSDIPMGFVVVSALCFGFLIISCVFYPVYNKGYKEGVEFMQQKLVKEGFAEYKYDQHGKPFWELKNKAE